MRTIPGTITAHPDAESAATWHKDKALSRDNWFAKQQDEEPHNCQRRASAHFPSECSQEDTNGPQLHRVSLVVPTDQLTAIFDALVPLTSAVITVVVEPLKREAV